MEKYVKALLETPEAVTKNEVLPPVATRMGVEGVMLSEESQISSL